MNELLCTRLVRQRSISWDPAAVLDLYVPCESCGEWTHRIERHHRKFRSRGGLWTPSNVLLLCHRCHRDATDEAPWTSYDGLNVHTWEEPTEVCVKLWYAEGMALLDDEGGYELVGL